MENPTMNTPQPDAQSTSGVNQILTKIEQGVEGQVKPDTKNAFDRIVVAGMKVMFDESTHKMMTEQLNPDDIVGSVPKGIATLMKILYMESKQKMPIPAAIPASIVLMTKALDFAERTMGVQLTPDLVAEVTQATGEAVLTAFGITKEMVEQVVQQSQQGKGPGQAPNQPPVQPQPKGLIAQQQQGV